VLEEKAQHVPGGLLGKLPRAFCSAFELLLLGVDVLLRVEKESM
jgi:hypothetical protein